MRIPNSVMVHQPHFLPWPSYMARVACCETFLVRNDVLYRKHYFHNRTKLRMTNGQLGWLSVPVSASSSTALEDVLLDASNRRRLLRISRAVEGGYRATRFYDEIWPSIGGLLSVIGTTAPQSRLVTVNLTLISALLHLIGVEPPRVVLASDISTSGHSRSHRIAGLIKAVGGEVYLTGWGASLNEAVLDTGVLSGMGISILSLDKEATRSVAPEFLAVEGLSTLHWLFTQPLNDVRRKLLGHGTAFVARSPRTA